MYAHYVLIHVKDASKAEEVASIIRSFGPRFIGLTNYNIEVNQLDNHDYHVASLAEFDSLESYQNFKVDPNHKAMNSAAGPMIERSTHFDFTR